MYVPIMPSQSYAGAQRHSNVKQNDNNTAVQDLLDREIQRRIRYNNSIFGYVFGKQTVDRTEVLKYFKSLRAMKDDRYLIASYFNVFS